MSETPIELEVLLELPQYRHHHIPCYPGNLWVVDLLLKEKMRAVMIGDHEYARALEETKLSICRYPFKIRNFARLPLMGMTKRVRDYLMKQPNYGDRVHVSERLWSRWFGKRAEMATTAVRDIIMVSDLTSIPIAKDDDEGLAWPKILMYRAKVGMTKAGTDNAHLTANNVKQTDNKLSKGQSHTSSGVEVDVVDEAPVSPSKMPVMPKPMAAKRVKDITDASVATPTAVTATVTDVSNTKAHGSAKAAGSKKKTGAQDLSAVTKHKDAENTVPMSSKRVKKETVAAQAAPKDTKRKLGRSNTQVPAVPTPKAPATSLRKGRSDITELSSITAGEESVYESADEPTVETGVAEVKSAKVKASAKSKTKAKAKPKHMTLTTRTRVIHAVYDPEEYEILQADNDSPSDASFRIEAESSSSGSEVPGRDSIIEMASEDEEESVTIPDRGTESRSAEVVAPPPRSRGRPKLAAVSKSKTAAPEREAKAKEGESDVIEEESSTAKKRKPTTRKAEKEAVEVKKKQSKRTESSSRKSMDNTLYQTKLSMDSTSSKNAPATRSTTSKKKKV